jgi:hypothetical protein
LDETPFPLGGSVFSLFEWIVGFLSGEFILANYKRPNSGSVVLFRSLWSAVWVYALVLIARDLVDPSRSFKPDWSRFHPRISERISLLGPIFAAIYLSLYTKFSSQWLYLANLYNQIKQAEQQREAQQDPAPSSEKFAEWKSGFIADADTVHLVTKSIFAYSVSEWSREKGVLREPLLGTRTLAFDAAAFFGRHVTLP